MSLRNEIYKELTAWKDDVIMEYEESKKVTTSSKEAGAITNHIVKPFLKKYMLRQRRVHGV